MSEKKVGAILTPSMREFFQESPDSEGAKARNVRQRVRSRFIAALEDIDLLFGTLRDEDRRQIVDKIAAPELDTYLEKFIAIFAQELDTDRFEGIIERGFQRALALEGYPGAEVSVRLTVDRHPADLSEVIEKIAKGDELTRKDATALVFADSTEVSDEEIDVLTSADDKAIQNLGKRLRDETESSQIKTRSDE